MGLAENISETKVDVRKKNRLNSPKRGGNSDVDSIPYLEELDIYIAEDKQPIQFTPNVNEHIHRWSPYVQGFSASFVQAQIDKYNDEYSSPVIMDPFAGCGTVAVQAKLNNLPSYGTELNPLLHFIAQTKLNSWDISPSYLRRIYNSLERINTSSAPDFLKSVSHFNPGVLENLELIKGGIDQFESTTALQQKAIDLIKVAFSAILIDCSNLTRSPCLGYSKKKKVEDAAPLVLMDQKIDQICNDLRIIRDDYSESAEVPSEIFLANAEFFDHTREYDLVITSPPYMNGMDYVMNYKIEMGWLGFAEEHKELKGIKDEMVVCDNVSKGLIREFASDDSKYTNEWLEEIKGTLRKNIDKRGSYRRMDMPHIVQKYFDDMHGIMRNVVNSIASGGRFVLVVGDSLIADTYLPTDLMLAKIGNELGLEVESVEKARSRRSGQIRSYELRETIVTLKKG